MSDQYPPSGVLFSNERKQKPNQPDYTGSLELSDEVVNDLVDQVSRGVSKPKISLAGWKRTSQKSGKTFVSLNGSVHQERQQQASPNANKPLDDTIPF